MGMSPLSVSAMYIVEVEALHAVAVCALIIQVGLSQKRWREAKSLVQFSLQSPFMRKLRLHDLTPALVWSDVCFIQLRVPGVRD